MADHSELAAVDGDGAVGEQLGPQAQQGEPVTCLAERFSVDLAKSTKGLKSRVGRPAGHTYLV